MTECPDEGDADLGDPDDDGAESVVLGAKTSDVRARGAWQSSTFNLYDQFDGEPNVDSNS